MVVVVARPVVEVVDVALAVVVEAAGRAVVLLVVAAAEEEAIPPLVGEPIALVVGLLDRPVVAQPATRVTRNAAARTQRITAEA